MSNPLYSDSDSPPRSPTVSPPATTWSPPPVERQQTLPPLAPTPHVTTLSSLLRPQAAPPAPVATATTSASTPAVVVAAPAPAAVATSAPPAPATPTSGLGARPTTPTAAATLSVPRPVTPGAPRSDTSESRQLMIEQADVEDLVNNIKRLERESTALNHSLLSVCQDNQRLTDLLHRAKQDLVTVRMNVHGDSLLNVIFDTESQHRWFGRGESKGGKEERAHLKDFCDQLQKEYIEYRKTHVATINEVLSLTESLKSAHAVLQHHAEVFNAAAKNKREITLNFADFSNHADGNVQETLNQLDLMVKKCGELDAANAALRADLSRRDATIAQMRNQSTAMSPQLEAAQRRVAELETQVNAAKADIVARDQALANERATHEADLKRQLAEVEARVKAEVSAREATIMQLRGQADKATHLEATQQRCNQLEAQLADLNAQLAARDEVIVMHGQHVADVKRQMSELEARSRADVEAREQALSQLRAETSRQLDAATRRASDLEQQNGLLKADLNTREQTLAQVRANHEAELQHRVAETDARAKADVSARDQTLLKQQSEVQQQLEAERRKASDLEVQLLQLRGDLSSRDQAIAQMRVSHEADMKRLQADVEARAKADVAAREHTMSQMRLSHEKDTFALRAQLNEALEELKSRNNAALRDAETRKNTAAATAQKDQTVERQQREAADQIQALQSKCEKLMRQVTAAEARETELHAALLKLQDENAALVRQNARGRSPATFGAKTPTSAGSPASYDSAALTAALARQQQLEAALFQANARILELDTQLADANKSAELLRRNLQQQQQQGTAKDTPLTGNRSATASNFDSQSEGGGRSSEYGGDDQPLPATLPEAQDALRRVKAQLRIAVTRAKYDAVKKQCSLLEAQVKDLKRKCDEQESQIELARNVMANNDRKAKTGQTAKGGATTAAGPSSALLDELQHSLDIVTQERDHYKQLSETATSSRAPSGEPWESIVQQKDAAIAQLTSQLAQAKAIDNVTAVSNGVDEANAVDASSTKPKPKRKIRAKQVGAADEEDIAALHQRVDRLRAGLLAAVERFTPVVVLEQFIDVSLGDSDLIEQFLAYCDTIIAAFDTVQGELEQERLNAAASAPPPEPSNATMVGSAVRPDEVASWRATVLAAVVQLFAAREIVGGKKGFTPVDDHEPFDTLLAQLRVTSDAVATDMKELFAEFTKYREAAEHPVAVVVTPPSPAAPALVATTKLSATLRTRLTATLSKLLQARSTIDPQLSTNVVPSSSDEELVSRLLSTSDDASTDISELYQAASEMQHSIDTHVCTPPEGPDAQAAAHNEALAAANAATEKAVKDRETLRAALQKDLDAARATVEKVTKERDELQAKEEALEKDLAKVRAESAKAAAAPAVDAPKITMLQNELKQTKLKLEAAQTEVSKLQATAAQRSATPPAPSTSGPSANATDDEQTKFWQTEYAGLRKQLKIANDNAARLDAQLRDKDRENMAQLREITELKLKKSPFPVAESDTSDMIALKTKLAEYQAVLDRVGITYPFNASLEESAKVRLKALGTLGRR